MFDKKEFEQAKNKRKFLRISFSKTLSSLEAVLKNEKARQAELTIAYCLLKDKYEEMEALTKNIIDFLSIEESAEADVEKEYDDQDVYTRKFLEVKYEVDARCASSSYEPGNVVQPNAALQGAKVTEKDSKKPYKLQTLEVKKFSGDVRDWLKFWSGFKKINDDPDIGKEDKLQLLSQSMVPNSRAEELVNSYPPTGENYPKVIESLKERYGRDDLQIEVYVRQLLQLVLQNAVAVEKMSLSRLYDKIESHLRALDTLGVTTEKCAAMLLPLVESSLPEDVLRVWQRSSEARNVDRDVQAPDMSKSRLTKLIQFLKAEVEGDQRISLAVEGFRLSDKADNGSTSVSKPRTRPETKDVATARNLIAGKYKEKACVFCEKTNHESAKCFKANKMSISEIKEILKSKRACFNCLNVGHTGKLCRVFVKCSKCSRHHVDLMCYKDEKLNEERNENVKSSVEVVNIKKECSLTTSSTVPSTIMQTLRIKVRNNDKEVTVRAVIDSGSQNSYILKSIARQLNYKPVGKLEMEHLLFGGKKSSVTEHNRYLIRVGNVNDSYRCNFHVLDENEICTDVPSVVEGSWLRELRDYNINLTDVGSPEKSVSILIGADIAGKLLTGKIRQLENGMTAIETHLGWTLMGKVPTITGRENLAVSAISLYVNSCEIEDLWSLDVLGIKDPSETKTQKKHDEEVQENLKKTVTKNLEGRYEVKLPWLELHPTLEDNKHIALQRLQHMVRGLRKLGKYEQYESIFQEWVQEGIIEQVPINQENSWGHYLPHRPVFKENSTTTTRPIFDASAEGKNYPSLNSCLEKGPNLIELVTDILLRFRVGKFGVVADIKKAFLQISVDPADRDFLRFLWYDRLGNIITYRHCRVVFGVCSSPFILGAIINLHLDNYINSLTADATKSEYVNAIKLKQSFYVDNCVTSLNSLNELNKFICNAKTVMAAGKFDLRGWEFTNDGNTQVPSVVLGILWDKESDTLSLNTSRLTKLEFSKVTKRNILSMAHRIFDPLGFISPVSLAPKILLQEAWAAKLSWDDEVSDEIKNKFFNWVNELKYIDQIKVPRCMIGDIDNDASISLHTFVDASKVAYATVIFIRVEIGLEVKVYFVQAKTRIAPTNKSKTLISMPRLELLAATIGARLTVQVKRALNLTDVSTYFWSDSSTVISWINRENNWSVFVSNRVKEIRELSDKIQWKHVPGHLNPADLPSRGCSANQLLLSSWWEGPVWLKEVPEKWPVHAVTIDENEVNGELKKSEFFSNKLQSAVLISSRDNGKIDNIFINSLLKGCSTYSKLITILGFIKRFVFNCKNKSKLKKEKFLTAEEYVKAENLLLKLIQNQHFKGLQDERIIHFLPFFDENGLIRMKSKILYRDDDLSFRCPIILPSNDKIVNLLILEKHRAFNHAGVQITMNALREEFWILKGRKTIRAVIEKCINCCRYDAKNISVQSPPLPLNRIKDAAVFEIVGVDLTGPLFLKGGQKAWVCIFTCAVYRAVHLELVNALSVASFLMAVRRFIARRGRMSVIYSDNGTNFVGLNNALQKIDYDKIAKTLAIEKIEWRFNPPSAPWWGGFWERLFGILKRLLRRTLKKSCLNYEEMQTILTDCEAVINSRPITFISDGFEEAAPLTPSMFLQEIKEIGVLDLDKIEQTDISKRFRYRIKLIKDLRSRFRIEYLGTLAHKRKKFSSEKSRVIKVGDIVLIGNDNTKRMDWPLARIKEVYSGIDGQIRVARLITASGEITRPVQRIYPLEICSNESENSEIEKVVIEKLNQTGKSKGDRKISDAKVGKNNLKEQKKENNEVTTRSGRVSKKPVRFN